MFLESKPNKPKVILFSEYKRLPFLLKAVSHAYHDTMHVGHVNSTEAALVKRFKITSFPSLIIVRKKSEKPLYFTGELKLNNVFDFLNPYSEKFVFGDVRAKLKEDEQKVMKPWLSEELPELTKESASDICFNTGKLCVIYLDTKVPDENAMSVLRIMKDKYAQDNKFSFMWLNAKIEKKFFKLFPVDESDLPKLAVLNAGSMKRVLIHGGAIKEKEITKTFEAIYNADARFNRLNMKTLPELVTREKTEKAEKVDL